MDEDSDAENRKTYQKLTSDIKYKTKSRPPTKHLFVPRSRLRESALLPVKLVPIKLEFEIESLKIHDVFTWNVNGTLFC
jgi:hypothetical protein